jgi:protein-S-isoprenylcysteine O-methyltransferase Ste14
MATRKYKMYKLISFVIVSAGFIFISRASLRAPRSHGFYRFFAWEFILALIVLNVDVWFRNPFSWHQLISWLLLFASLIPLGFGFHALATQGKAAKRRADDAQLLTFEKTTRLITTGVFAYIRHPLYSSLLLLAWGVFFKVPGWSGILLVLAATFSLIATAKADEAECIRYFGPSYQAYMEHTRMFVPYIF